SDFIYLFTF
ncbi:rCG47918, partial [Rattus norvegicus]